MYQCFHGRHVKQEKNNHKPRGPNFPVWTSGMWSSYLRELLLAEGTLGVVVQAPLQTLQTEGVATGRRHRLVEEPEEGRRKETAGGELVQ